MAITSYTDTQTVHDVYAVGLRSSKTRNRKHAEGSQKKYKTFISHCQDLSKGRVDIKEELALNVPAGMLPKVSLVPPKRQRDSSGRCMQYYGQRKEPGCSLTR